MSSFQVLFTLVLLILNACTKDASTPTPEQQNTVAFEGTKTVTYNNVSVDVIIDKPALAEMDVIIAYHGTVIYDSLVLDAARTTLSKVNEILDREDIMIVSVAYPEQNLLMGDNIRESEAALLWVKNMASKDMGIKVKKIFLCGHSQGGYIVTRLNTMYQTNGVVANAPGPLNLVYRCQLEENGSIPQGITCTLLRNTYGTTAANPGAYHARSLLNFTKGFLSDILFVQGLDDTPIQMYSWPKFKQDVMSCSTCKNSQFLEIDGVGHSALFLSTEAKTAFNQFINSR
jgi:hypothetical protein